MGWADEVAAFKGQQQGSGLSWDFASPAQAQPTVPGFGGMGPASGAGAFRPLTPGASSPSPLSGVQQPTSWADEVAKAKAGPTFTSNFANGLMTNNPPQGVGGFLGRATPAIAGSIIGAPAGPLGMGATAMALQSVRNAAANTLSAQDPNRYGQPMSPGAVLTDAGKTFAFNAAVPAAFEVGGGVLSGGLQGGADALESIGSKAGYVPGGPAAPSVPAVAGKAGAGVKVGAQIIRAASGVPTKYGEGALTGALDNAPSLAENSQAYKELFDAHGLMGLDEASPYIYGTRVPGAANWRGTFDDAMDKMASGKLDVQDAVLGSQAAAKIKDLARMGNPELAGAMKSVTEGKQALDAFLETKLPGYAAVRAGRFAGKTAQAFSSFMPQNKNLSPNVLRGAYAAYQLKDAGQDALQGDYPGAAGHLVGAAAVSPMMWGLGIQGARAMGPFLPYSGPALQQAYDAMGYGGTRPGGGP